VAAPLPFRLAGVVNIAEDQDGGLLLRHNAGC
jgi:hypothetical protein